MFYVLAVLPVIVVLFMMFRRESKRQDAVKLKEDAFLASVRANPQATTTPLVGKPAPERPNAAAMLAADAITTGMARAASFVPEPTAMPAPTARPMGMPAGIAPAAGFSVSGGDSHCVLCTQLVDVKSSDPTLWGVKIPDEASGRFRWYHFNCATHALHRATLLESSLNKLVAAHTPEGQGTLAAALAEAQGLIGPTPHPH